MIQDIHLHLFENSFVVTSGIQDDDYVFCFRDNALLLKQGHEAIEIPRKRDFEGNISEVTFLFKLDNTRCFLVMDSPEQDQNQFFYHEVRSLNAIPRKEIDWAGGVAFQLRNWYTQNKFCGKCGSRTNPGPEERSLICPSCQTIRYPNISPAIIVALLHEDKILLARNANFPVGFYSIVAGYVEIGETVEDAVKREVKEEVGLQIKNIRYYKSQPWPFSGSMMLGFIAEIEGEPTIRIDEKEIVEADWYSRNDLPGYPPNRSIAGEMIEKFRKGEL
jgi:NAD+ diphosphatase